MKYLALVGIFLYLIYVGSQVGSLIADMRDFNDIDEWKEGEEDEPTE